jgi:hypothetical protein
VAVPGIVLAESSEEPPIGAYLWYPEAGGPKSDKNCLDLVARGCPTKEKAEMSLWGSIPESDPAIGSFFLLLSETRMEPTYGAEGDYDFGDVQLGKTEKRDAVQARPGRSPGHDVDGTIVASPGREIVTVTLHGIPTDGGRRDRTTYFCRFEDEDVET